MKQFGWISGVLIVVLCCTYGIHASEKSGVEISSFSNRAQQFHIEDTLNSEEPIPVAVLEGGRLFNTQCQRCHSTSVSHAKNPQGWKEIISRMAGNAGLDSLKQADLTAFVLWELERTDTSIIIMTIGGYQQW